MREILKTILKTNGLNQRKLAALSGVSRVTINRYLTGKSDVGSHKLLKMLDVLGLKVVLEKKG